MPDRDEPPRADDDGSGGFSRRFSDLKRKESADRTDITPAGDRQFEELQRKLSKMLWSGATLRGHRRRASMLDVQDFDGAFSDIVSPADRSRWANLTAELCVLAAGLFTGYAINILTGTTPETPVSAWLIPLAAGIIIGIVAIAVKCIKLS